MMCSVSCDEVYLYLRLFCLLWCLCEFICLFVCFVMYLVSAPVSNISAIINSIPMLNGTNFKEWRENVLIVLGVMDLDLALRIDHPAEVTEESSSHSRMEIEKWERSNWMSLIIMKRDIPEAFRGTMYEEIVLAKDFLTNLENRFAKNEKTKTRALLANLISMRYKGKGNIGSTLWKCLTFL